MLSVIVTGIIGAITIGGSALFLKNEKPVVKWGGLVAFGVGLLSLCVGLSLIPSP